MLKQAKKRKHDPKQTLDKAKKKRKRKSKSKKKPKVQSTESAKKPKVQSTESAKKLKVESTESAKKLKVESTESAKTLPYIILGESSSKTNGTCLQGCIKVPYVIIKAILGESYQPEGLCDDEDDEANCGVKVHNEWAVQFANGEVATIYDWKVGCNEVETEWNIGGHTKRAVELVYKLFDIPYPPVSSPVEETKDASKDQTKEDQTKDLQILQTMTGGSDAKVHTIDVCYTNSAGKKIGGSMVLDGYQYSENERRIGKDDGDDSDETEDSDEFVNNNGNTFSPTKWNRVAQRVVDQMKVKPRPLKLHAVVNLNGKMEDLDDKDDKDDKAQRQIIKLTEAVTGASLGSWEMDDLHMVNRDTIYFMGYSELFLHA